MGIGLVKLHSNRSRWTWLNYAQKFVLGKKVRQKEMWHLVHWHLPKLQQKNPMRKLCFNI